MACNQWPPRKHVVNVAIAIYIINIGAFSAFDEEWLPANSLKSSDRRIDTLDAMKKSKLVMIAGDPLAHVTMKAVGLTPIPLNVTDVLTSLATGQIDTVYISPSYAISLQWNTKLSYIVDFPLTNGTGSNPTHTYQSPGFYVARVMVTDDYGNIDFETVDITVRQPPQLIDLGNRTRDEATGLDWLDVTETVSLSYDAIVAGTGGWGATELY